LTTLIRKAAIQALKSSDPQEQKAAEMLWSGLPEEVKNISSINKLTSFLKNLIIVSGIGLNRNKMIPQSLRVYFKKKFYL
jgi:hypothetical protein